MKRPILKLALLVTGVFLVGLLVKFPAQVAVNIAASQLPGFTAGAARGSLWQGEMQEARIAGRELDRVRWNIKPLALFLLELSADIEIQQGSDTVTGRVAATPGGSLEASELRGSMSLATLGNWRLMPQGLATGELLLDIDSLHLEDGSLQSATGRAQLTELRSRMLEGTPLGDYAATLETTEGGIRIDFREIEAPLELQGTAVLAADGSYTTQGNIRPTDATPEQLRKGMGFLGQPDASGRYRFSFNGRL